MRKLLDIPDEFITAAHVAVGYPARGFPDKLTRHPVEGIVYSERFGPPLYRR